MKTRALLYLVQYRRSVFCLASRTCDQSAHWTISIPIIPPGQALHNCNRYLWSMSFRLSNDPRSKLNLVRTSLQRLLHLNSRWRKRSLLLHQLPAESMTSSQILKTANAIFTWVSSRFTLNYHSKHAWRISSKFTTMSSAMRSQPTPKSISWPRYK